jgi:hypothetical protein
MVSEQAVHVKDFPNIKSLTLSTMAKPQRGQLMALCGPLELAAVPLRETSAGRTVVVATGTSAHPARSKATEAAASQRLVVIMAILIERERRSYLSTIAGAGKPGDGLSAVTLHPAKPTPTGSGRLPVPSTPHFLRPGYRAQQKPVS